MVTRQRSLTQEARMAFLGGQSPISDENSTAFRIVNHHDVNHVDSTFLFVMLHPQTALPDRTSSTLRASFRAQSATQFDGPLTYFL